MARVDIDSRAFLDSFEDELREMELRVTFEAERFGERVIQMTKPMVRVDTGATRDSYEVKGVTARPGSVTVEMGSDHENAPRDEFGTRPHIIEPKQAKVLHWVDEAGNDVFAARVHHPGTKPTFAFRTGLRETQDSFRWGL